MNNKKYQIFMWGVGKWANKVFEALDMDLCEIKGVVDSDRTKQGTIWRGDITIEAPDILQYEECDYIIIAVKRNSDILKLYNKMGLCKEKLLVIGREDLDLEFLDYNVIKTCILEEELERYKLRLENAPYELGVKQVPVIKSAEELLKNIIAGNNSLCRFGDGELELMRGHARPWFQSVDIRLQKKLKEVFDSNLEKIYIAVSDNFGSLEDYTEDAADSIRYYMSGTTREEVTKILGFERTYYNAYVSRPYIMYRDKSYAEKIFNLFKKIWENRHVIIIEGEYTRNGVGNDLFTGTKSLKRILCPTDNAFSKYDYILKTARENTKEEDLILITLGPTATVLAYDLAQMNRQAIDIGQLDNEYEWYLRGAEERMEIEGKIVAELNWCHSANDIIDKQYESQIIAKIQ